MKKRISAYFKRLVKREIPFTPTEFIILLGFFAIMSGNAVAYISSPYKWLEALVFTILLAFGRAFSPDD